MNAIAQDLKILINGDTEIYQWHDIDINWQNRITPAIATAPPSTIIYPKSTEELVEVMTHAHKQGWAILPCGKGSKLSWGGLVKNVNVVISLERLDRLIEHAVGDLTVTVEAGMKFATLQDLLAQSNQFLPLDPAYPEDSTIGGIIATADTGSWRQRYGGVRDMLLGLSFVRPDGQIAKAGGRVVKNVAGYDLMKLFTGSYGTLGIISQVTLRVYPLPDASSSIILTGEAEALTAATRTLLTSALTPTVIDVLSPQLVQHLGLGQQMGMIVRFQTVPESVQQQSTRLIEIGQQLNLQHQIYSDALEIELWNNLRQHLWNSSNPQATTITCKIGVRPSAAVSLLHQYHQLIPESIGVIHAASGLGILQFEPAEHLPQLRQNCQAQGGFLSILEAPTAVKQQFDVWGYNGNALNIMRQLKKQFDPKNLLSPHRFVAGI